MDNKNKELNIKEASSDISSKRAPRKKRLSNKKNILWTLLFVAIAGLTVYTITSQSQSFSIKDFLLFVSKANPLWIIAAVFGMLGFIVFEGMALNTLCKGFGYKKGFWNGYIYSAGDIYVSAITPSASGGQPASAYFMVRDGIRGSVTTVILLLNVVLYIFSILIIGIICFVAMPSEIFAFSTLSKALIISGAVALSSLALIFILLLKKQNLLHAICRKFIRLLAKLKIIKDPDSSCEKLSVWIASYRECAKAIKGKRNVIMKALAFNLLQRISQLSITVFAFLAVGGATSSVPEVFVMQEMVVVGSNCIPIPGAMGVADYLMLDAFSTVVEPSVAVNLELLARTFSFYLCVLLCGFSFFIRLVQLKNKSKKNKV